MTCTICNGSGFIYDRQRELDACPACAVAAEIDYIEWKRHGPAQLSFDLETDTGPDLPENVLDLRQARHNRQ